MADVQKIKALVDEKADKFVGVANQVWSTPELGFKEEKSAAALIAALESEGFKVTTGSGGPRRLWPGLRPQPAGRRLSGCCSCCEGLHDSERHQGFGSLLRLPR